MKGGEREILAVFEVHLVDLCDTEILQDISAVPGTSILDRARSAL